MHIIYIYIYMYICIASPGGRPWPPLRLLAAILLPHAHVYDILTVSNNDSSSSSNNNR